jgi:hypothetical protein
VSGIRKDLSDYADKRMSYASEPQALATKALLEIHHLDEHIAELEAAGKSLISEIGEGSAADWPELHLEADKLRKLLTQQPAKEQAQ